MICPSILSADFSSLKETLQKLEHAGVRAVHFDVMDNHFVPNLTFGSKFIQDLRPHSYLFFDVHLMIDHPENTLELYLEAGADLVTVHFEATEPSLVRRMSHQIRQAGKKFGVSLKPGTEVSHLESFLEDIDLILIMTVEPGFGGQKFMDSCLPKIREARRMIGSRDILIQVDGGIHQDNLEKVYQEGARWFVLGSAFFRQEDFAFFPNLLRRIENEQI